MFKASSSKANELGTASDKPKGWSSLVMLFKIDSRLWGFGVEPSDWVWGTPAAASKLIS